MLISPSQKLPLIIGHRGASREAPENTLESFRRALTDGATADRAVLGRELAGTLIEFDKEIHVRTVDRSSNARRLCNLGVGSIMTNRPGWLRQKLATRENMS